MRLISFVMPALNEEEGIAHTIKLIPLKALNNLGFDVEIIVVDGGSSDKTRDLATKLGAEVVLSPKGYGRQYKKGFDSAKGEIIVTGDSDGTYPFDKVIAYISFLDKNNLDFVTVNRFAYMEPGAMHWSNKIGNLGLTLSTNLLFRLKLKDSQSGMWVFRREALDKLNVKSDGMAFSQELKIEAFTKLASGEVSGRYRSRLGETKLLKIKDGWSNLKALFDKRFNNS